MSVSLTWDNAATPDAVLVYRDTSPIPATPASLTPFAALPPAALSFLDTTALSSTLYYYRVANVQYGTTPATYAISSEISVATGSAQPGAGSDVVTIDYTTVAVQADLDVAVAGFDEVVITIVDADYSGDKRIALSTDGGTTYTPISDANFRSNGLFSGPSTSGAVGGDQLGPYAGAGGTGAHGALRITGLPGGRPVMWAQKGADTQYSYFFDTTGIYRATAEVTHIRIAQLASLLTPRKGVVTVERIKHRSVAAMPTLDFNASVPPNFDLNIAGADRVDWVAEGILATTPGQKLEVTLSALGPVDGDFQTGQYGRIIVGRVTGPWRITQDPTTTPQTAHELHNIALTDHELAVASFFGVSDAAYPFLHGVASDRFFGGMTLIERPRFMRFKPQAAQYTAGVVKSQKVSYHSQSVTETAIAGGETAIAFDVSAAHEAQMTWSGPITLSAADRLILQVSTDGGATWRTTAYYTGGYNVIERSTTYASALGVALSFTGANNLFGQALVTGLQAGAYCAVQGGGSRTGVGTTNGWSTFGVWTGGTQKVTNIRLTTAGGATFSTGRVECRMAGYFTAPSTPTIVNAGFADPDTFGTSNIGNALQTIANAGFADADVFGANALNLTGQIVNVTHTDPDTFGANALIADQTITGATYSDPDAFGTSSLANVLQFITNVGYADPDTFGANTLALPALPSSVIEFAQPEDMAFDNTHFGTTITPRGTAPQSPATAFVGSGTAKMIGSKYEGFHTDYNTNSNGYVEIAHPAANRHLAVVLRRTSLGNANQMLIGTSNASTFFGAAQSGSSTAAHQNFTFGAVDLNGTIYNSGSPPNRGNVWTALGLSSTNETTFSETLRHFAVENIQNSTSLALRLAFYTSGFLGKFYIAGYAIFTDWSQKDAVISALKSRVAYPTDSFWRLLVTLNNGDGTGRVSITQLRYMLSGSEISTYAQANGNSWMRSGFNGTMECRTVFDGNAGTFATSQGSAAASAGEYYAYYHGATMAPDAVKIRCLTSPNQTFAPRDFKIQKSSDALTWTTVKTVTGETGWTSNEERTFTIP